MIDIKRVELKDSLLERKRALEEQLSELYVHEVSDQVQDSGDQALSSSMETLRLSLQEADMDEYHRIIQALQMLDEGTYGICLECESEISGKRLKLYPNATRCLVCQEALEERS